MKVTLKSAFTALAFATAGISLPANAETIKLSDISAPTSAALLKIAGIERNVQLESCEMTFDATLQKPAGPFTCTTVGKETIIGKIAYGDSKRFNRKTPTSGLCNFSTAVTGPDMDCAKDGAFLAVSFIVKELRERSFTIPVPIPRPQLATTDKVAPPAN